MEIEWAGEPLTLWPERAVFRPATRDLLIADPHFGKDAAFRRHGLPVPIQAHRDDLDRLRRLVDRTAPARLVILGDFLHSRAARTDETQEAFLAWRDQVPDLPILLIRGNHDRSAGDPPPSFAIECVSEPFAAAPYTYVHHPSTRRPAGQLAGHLHPGIVLRSPRGPRVRLPCFHVTPRALVLPAFGSFTGLADITPAPPDQVIAVVPPSTLVTLPIP